MGSYPPLSLLSFFKEEEQGIYVKIGTIFLRTKEGPLQIHILKLLFPTVIVF